MKKNIEKDNSTLIKEFYNNPLIITLALDHGVSLSFELLSFYIDSLKAKKQYETISYIFGRRLIHEIKETNEIYQKCFDIFNELQKNSKYLEYKLNLYDDLYTHLFKINKKNHQNESIKNQLQFFHTVIKNEKYIPCLMLIHDYLSSDAKSPKHYNYSLLLTLTSKLNELSLKEEYIHDFIKYTPEIIYEVSSESCDKLLDHALKYYKENPKSFRENDISDFMYHLTINPNCPAQSLWKMESFFKNSKQRSLLKNIQDHKNYNKFATGILGKIKSK